MRALLLLVILAVIVAPHCVFAQGRMAPETPTAPGQTPEPAPSPTPVPVIPDVQPIGPPPTVSSAPLRLLPTLAAGVPPTATFALQPSLTLIEEYSDNFNLTERDKQSNFRSTLVTGLQLVINSAFTKGIIAYGFAPTHDTATSDVGFFHSLLGQIVWEVNPRWRLTVADALSRSDEPGEADRLGLRQERRTFTTNTFSLSSDYLIGTVATRQSYRTSIFFDEGGSETTSHTLAAGVTVPVYQTNLISAGYDYLRTTTTNGATSNASSGASNGSEDISGHQLSASARRQLTTLTSVGLATSYAFRTVTTNTSETDYQLWNVSTFTNHVLAGRLTLDSSLGVSGLTTSSGETLGPHLSTATSLRYQFARAVLSLAVDSGFSETFRDGQNFGVVETDGITGSLSYPFTPWLSGTVAGFYRRNKFTGVTTDTAGGNERTENWGGTMSFSWRFLRRFLLDLSYSYLTQTGSGAAEGQVGDGNGYTENRIRAAINVSF